MFKCYEYEKDFSKIYYLDNENNVIEKNLYKLQELLDLYFSPNIKKKDIIDRIKLIFTVSDNIKIENIDNVCAGLLIKFIQQEKIEIKRLDLSYSCSADSGNKFITHAFANYFNTINLKSFVYGHNKKLYNSEVLISLGKGLETNTKLRSLDLSFNGIKSDCKGYSFFGALNFCQGYFSAFLQSLKKNSSIKELDLSANDISDLLPIIDLLKSKSFISLDLSANPINIEHAEILLEKLQLAENDLDNNLSSLTELKLERCGLPQKLLENFESFFLQHNMQDQTRLYSKNARNVYNV